MEIYRPLAANALFLCIFAHSASAESPTKTPGGSPAPLIDKRLESAAVSDAEKIRQSGDMLRRSRQNLKEVLEKLEEARNSKDILKLNCVNEKLTQIKGLLKVIESADVTLQENIAKRETSAAEQEFTKESVAFRRLEGLRAEVEECIGQLAFQIGDQTVEFDVPDNLPGDDITKPKDPTVVLVRNPPASP